VAKFSLSLSLLNNIWKLFESKRCADFDEREAFSGNKIRAMILSANGKAGRKILNFESRPNLVSLRSTEDPQITRNEAASKRRLMHRQSKLRKLAGGRSTRVYARVLALKPRYTLCSFCQHIGNSFRGKFVASSLRARPLTHGRETDGQID